MTQIAIAITLASGIVCASAIASATVVTRAATRKLELDRVERTLRCCVTIEDLQHAAWRQWSGERPGLE